MVENTGTAGIRVRIYDIALYVLKTETNLLYRIVAIEIPSGKRNLNMNISALAN